MTTRHRIWWVPQIPMKAFVREVPDLATAQILVDTLADYDLFQYENKVKPDYANTGGIQSWDEECQEWVEVDEDDE